MEFRELINLKPRASFWSWDWAARDESCPIFLKKDPEFNVRTVVLLSLQIITLPTFFYVFTLSTFFWSSFDWSKKLQNDFSLSEDINLHFSMFMNNCLHFLVLAYKLKKRENLPESCVLHRAPNLSTALVLCLHWCPLFS